MKTLNSMFALTGIIFCLFVNLFAQTSKPRQQVGSTPVALGKIYELPEESDEPIEGANPSLTRKVLYAYIAVIEWHFEMRFTDAEAKEYERILVKDWNTSATARKNINGAYAYFTKLNAMSANDLSTEFYNRKSVETWDIAREGILNQAPQGLRGLYKKLAAEGNEEGVFVWNKVNEYEKPLVAGNTYNKPLNRKHIDATTEWVAYQINVVANKEVFVLDDEKRQQMEDLLISQWKKEVVGTDTISNNLTIALTFNVFRWQDLRIHRKYSFDGYITNYNKLSNMVEWSKIALYYCPSIKPFAEQRVKEYRDYAAKMNENEWNLELYRLKSQMKMQNIAMEALKRQQLESHVLTMNILERPDSGYHWVIKEKPY